jgi:MarR family transcriptional repressor of mepA
MDYKYGHEIMVLSSEIKRNINKRIISDGLSGSKGKVLHYIAAHKNENIYQKDIEDEFNLRAASATELLQSLEKSGYIHRESSSLDRRKKKIILKPEASELSLLAGKDLSALESDLISGIDNADLEIFRIVLGKMAENLDKK